MRVAFIGAFLLLVLPLGYYGSKHLHTSLHFSLPSISLHSSTPTSVAPFHEIALDRYVNPFIGTAGNGNVFPGADVPFGMVQWSPESTAGGLSKPGGYNAGDLIMRGFGLTHLSGAGCVSFENIPIMPTIRPITDVPLPNGSPYSDRFLPATQQASPGYYGVQLKSGIGIQLTVTPRSGFGRITFPATNSASLLIDAGNAAGRSSNIDGADASTVHIVGSNEVTGSVTGGHFCNMTNRYTLYFAVHFDRPFTAAGVWQDGILHSLVREATGRHTGGFATFDTRRNPLLGVKVGVSYVSIANAEGNLRVEDPPGRRFGSVRQRAAAAWNHALNRAQVHGGSIPDRQTFYTALYHSLLQPNVFSDVNGQYQGFDGRVHQAHGYIQYANFSGWDIYRSEMPLLAWLVPHQAADMAQSLLAAAHEAGYLPKWPVANANTGEMNGDSADPILATTWAFGAHHFDGRTALAAMVKGATRSGKGSDGYEERPQLAGYLQLGYVPPATGGWGAAATTLEFALDDYAIAQMAGALGQPGTHATFLRRAENWRKLWDPATGFLRPRNADGSFVTPFTPTATDGYVEGNAAQYAWMVPQNLSGLFQLMGGSRRVVPRLDQFFSRLNAGPQSPYYWAGNEPGLEAPWEYDFAGRPGRTQQLVRRIMRTAYGPAVNGLPGNDDLGTMSAWYVWSALGLYPEVPGVGGFALATPLFPKTILHVAAHRTVTIVAPGAAASKPFHAGVRINGRPHRGAWLPLNALPVDVTVTFTGIS